MVIRFQKTIMLVHFDFGEVKSIIDFFWG